MQAGEVESPPRQRDRCPQSVENAAAIQALPGLARLFERA